MYSSCSAIGINWPSLMVGMGFLSIKRCRMPACARFLTLCVCVSGTGLEKTQRQGVEELISAMPCNFDHASLFIMLQKHTLLHRMNDSFSCLVRAQECVVMEKMCYMTQDDVCI